MVSATVLAGIFSFIGTVFLGLLYLTLWTWRHSAALGGEDEERVVELESHHRSLVDDELTKLYTEIESLLNDAGELPSDLGRREHVANVIHREIGRDDIEPIVSKLDEVDDPVDFFDGHKEAYRAASKNFLFSCIFTLGLGGILAAVTVLQNDPFTGGGPFAYFFLAILIINFGWDGIRSFLNAQGYKDDFEELWREYKRLD